MGEIERNGKKEKEEWVIERRTVGKSLKVQRSFKHDDARGAGS